MINKYEAPIISSDDSNLPLCIVTAGEYPQHKINRPFGIPHQQILLTTKGSGMLYLNKKKYILSTGDILFTPSNTPQKYQPIDNWETMYITYLSNLSTDYFEFPDKIFHTEDLNKYVNLILDILSINNNSDFCRKSSSILYEFLLELRAEMSKTHEPNNRISHVHSYIQNHYFEEIDVATLSGMCGLVPEYFSRLYKKIYHMSPIEHIHKLRMQDAKKKLIFSTMPISYVAKSVGFNSPSHFGKLFKQHESMTPNQFRSNYQPKQTIQP